MRPPRTTTTTMMTRTAVAAATLALTAGLVGPATSASAAARACADPAQPITALTGVDVAVGTTKVRTVGLGVDTAAGCGVDSAVAVFTGPRRTFRVALHPTPDPEGEQVRWTGHVRLDPRRLRDAEAGTWTLRYEVRGASVAQTWTEEAQVRRATRSTFDAGPEPVRDGRLTVRGTLERASWDAHRYRRISRPVVVRTHDRHDDSFDVDVVALRTRKDGTFRRTVPFPGAGPYWVAFDGGTVSAPSESRADRVAAG